VLLTIEPQRIEISTTQEGVDCGVVLGKILRRLKETPLTAVGLNVAYSRIMSDENPLPGISALPSAVGGERVTRRIVGLTFDIEENVSNSIGLEQLDRLAKAHGNAERKDSDVESLIAWSESFSDSIALLLNRLKAAWQIEVTSTNTSSDTPPQ